MSVTYITRYRGAYTYEGQGYTLYTNTYICIYIYTNTPTHTSTHTCVYGRVAM